MLTPLKFMGRDKRSHPLWLFQCRCGQKKVMRSDNGARSCGCSKRQPKTHGHAVGGRHSRTYVSWHGMRTRCLNPQSRDDHKYYWDYAVTICKRWNKFENFLADMGERPAGKSLDRFPNPWGNYKPSNCRWATPYEQTHNRRQSWLNRVSRT